MSPWASIKCFPIADIPNDKLVKVSSCVGHISLGRISDLILFSV